MDFLSISKKRSSIRDYSSKKIEQEKLDYILEAARLSPSACNFQPWYIVLIESDKGKEMIRATYPREWFNTAPLYLLICSNHQQGWKRASDNKDFTDVDISILTEHLCLAAAEQGLGTCWVCNFDATLCSSSFNLPDSVEPLVILPIGYPTNESLFDVEKKRKPLNEILIKESF